MQDTFLESQQAAMEWLSTTVRGLVDDPGAVFIETRVMDTVTEFDVKVGAGDIGKIIGKNGHNARALRTIFFAMGRKAGTRYELQLLEIGVPPVRRSLAHA